jgi:hypothetical protein
LKLRWKTLVVLLLVVGSSFLWVFWKQGQSRRDSIKTLNAFSQSLNSRDPAALLDKIVLPQAIKGQTVAEQTDFLVKALHDEISPEGILALKHHAEFGSLKTIFPNEAADWCSQAGVNADDCVAFKMERAGIQAEIVLVHEGQNYRVVRCKDVKQMAGVNSI